MSLLSASGCFPACSKKPPGWPANKLEGGVLDPEASSPSNSVDYVNENTFEVYENDSNSIMIYGDTFYGGTPGDNFDNDGDTTIDESDERYTMATYAADPSNDSYGINTDDPKWKTDLNPPSASSIISGMNGYYNDAYITVEEQTTGNTNSSFNWYRTTTSQLATADVPGDGNYWTACVGWGYEYLAKVKVETGTDYTLWAGDNDPQNEGFPAGHYAQIHGKADSSNYERCMIYLESNRESSKNESMIVSHEVGHCLGLNHSAYDPSTGFEALRDGADCKLAIDPIAI